MRFIIGAAAIVAATLAAAPAMARIAIVIGAPVVARPVIVAPGYGYVAPAPYPYLGGVLPPRCFLARGPYGRPYVYCR